MAVCKRQDSGFPFKDRNGVWHNVLLKFPAGLFEESFKRTLLDVGFSDDEIATLTQPAIARRPKLNTRSFAQQGGQGWQGWQSAWSASSWR